MHAHQHVSITSETYCQPKSLQNKDGDYGDEFIDEETLIYQQSASVAAAMINNEIIENNE